MDVPSLGNSRSALGAGRQPLLFALLFVLAAAPVLPAEQWPGEANEAPPTLAEQAMRLGESAGAEIAPLVHLQAAAEAALEDLRALEEHNARRPPRLQNGFSRSFPPRPVRLAADLPAGSVASAHAGGLVRRQEGFVTWTAKIVVDQAFAFRARLDHVALPRGAGLWVYSPSGPVLGPLGIELLDAEGRLWLPPVEGSTQWLEARVPEEALAQAPASFSIGEVMELVDVAAPEIEPEVWTDCDIDGTCVTSGTLADIANYRASIARLSFVVGGGSFLCSGGLVNDTDTTGFRPFLLTANHCFSSQSSASSLVAYFDYKTSSCNGSAPSLGSVPQVSGSTLLASNSESDFTFVELSANPSGFRWYLGWTTATPANGETLYRLSHPLGLPQKFSTQQFLSTGGITCGSVPRPDFHYSQGVTGSTAGGSSGSPVIDAGGHIVGQLLGACHFVSWDDCSYNTYNYVDGAFATTFGYISSWLADPGGSCTDDAFEEDDACFGTFIGFATPRSHLHCDEDWHWFAGVAGATYRIETSGLIGGSDTTVALHRDCGTLLAFDDDSGAGLASRIDFTASSTAAYDIRVRQFADLYGDGKGYTLTVTCLSGCAGGPLVFQDGFESGDLSAWSLTVP